MVVGKSDTAVPPATSVEGQDGSAAKRAIEEARRRRESSQADGAAPIETGGRGGLEPVRYGDWEIKGVASDF